ncbi:hypothetical protein SNE40_017579 [Patella caerulea]
MMSKWLNNIRREQYTPSKTAVLCSNHFEEKFLYKFGRNVTLRENAIPTIFSFPQHLQKTSVTERKTSKTRITENKIEKVHTMPEKLESFLNVDHTYCVTESPKTTKRRYEAEVNHLRKKIKTSHQKSRRLKRKITSLQTIVEMLKQEKLISESCSRTLESTFTGIPLALMKRIVTQKHVAYTKELRSFAMTLQFYSAKAYDYVRKTFDLALPHPSRIRKWYSLIHADPGFTESSFTALEAKVKAAAENNKKVICSLAIDEMSVKKHVQWDGQKFRGYIDIGSLTTSDDDAMPLAKDALVFLVTAVNGHWKVPCAFFWIDGMSGEERANLVQECLRRLHDIGVQTVSLTCDGPSCHLSMFKALGALISPSNMSPSFPHPSDENLNVYILLDICHMLKLIRNSFASGGLLKNGNGEIIKWKYLVDLNNLQNSEGLRLANKLRSSHINWDKQKMKVNLAAQVLSNSVADALEFCCDVLKLPDFQGCKATVEFIRLFNNLFDIFNSKNSFQKGFKSPLREVNYNYWHPYLETCYTYISQLTDTSGLLMTSTRRKTGFIGFLVAIRTFQGLYNDLILTKTLNYILTYKFSQDHIELFFGAVRACGRFNNNPTAQQFVAAYKRLLLRSAVGGKGNCQRQDDTDILFLGDSISVNNVECSASDISVRRKYGLDQSPTCLDDHNYIKDNIPNLWTSSFELSEYKEVVVGYIAGYVVNMVKRHIKCVECQDVLTLNDTNYINKLVMFKDKGGLCKPSKDVVNICRLTEKCINHILLVTHGKLPHGQDIMLGVTTTVVKMVDFSRIFQQLNTHIINSSLDDNHVHRLVKVIAKSYASIKLYHLGKQQNELDSHSKIRK